MAIPTHKMAWVMVALSFVAISGFALVTSTGDSAVTFKLPALGDTYVSTASPTTAYGGASVIWVSKATLAENWGLVSFNVASKLSPTMVIASARVKLLVEQSSGTFPAQMVTVRLLADFSESSVTYVTVPAAALDISTNTLFSKRPMPGFTVFVDVTKQLMAWRSSGQRTAFGILLNMASATTDAGIAFASHENPDQNGPVLQIFTVPPGQYGYSVSHGEIWAIRPET